MKRLPFILITITCLFLLAGISAIASGTEPDEFVTVHQVKPQVLLDEPLDINLSDTENVRWCPATPIRNAGRILIWTIRAPIYWARHRCERCHGDIRNPGAPGLGPTAPYFKRLPPQTQPLPDTKPVLPEPVLPAPETPTLYTLVSMQDRPAESPKVDNRPYEVRPPYRFYLRVAPFAWRGVQPYDWPHYTQPVYPPQHVYPYVYPRHYFRPYLYPPIIPYGGFQLYVY